MLDLVHLTLYTDSFFNKSLEISLNGFIFKFNDHKYIITVHHNLPINMIKHNNSLLNVKINSNWSEILILDLPEDLFDYKIHKLYQHKLPSINDILTIKSNDHNLNVNVIGFNFLPFDNLPNSSKIIYIKAKITEDYDLLGLSGCPVYYNNILVGVMSKWNIRTSTVYIIPFYVIIKNLLKTNNNNIYLLNNSIRLKKIGYYNIKDNNTIYHRCLKYYIPIDTYILLEGDDELHIDFISESNINIRWENIKEKISHDANIINNNDSYKITNRLLSIMNRLNIDKKILMNILHKYINNPLEKFYINNELMIV